MRINRTLTLAAFLCLWTNFGRAQNTTSPPEFEAAAIKPCEPGTPEPAGQRMGMVRYIFPGGRFEAKAVTVEFLLEWAYDLLPSQHSRGPAWMQNDRFDIVAKAGGNATDDQMKLMARTLLAERFHLKFHRETREAWLAADVRRLPLREHHQRDGVLADRHHAAVALGEGDDDRLANGRERRLRRAGGDSFFPRSQRRGGDAGGRRRRSLS